MGNKRFEESVENKEFRFRIKIGRVGDFCDLLEQA